MGFCRFVLVILGQVANLLYAAIVEVGLDDLLFKSLLLLQPLSRLVLGFVVLNLLGRGSLAVNSVDFGRLQYALQIHRVNSPLT